MELTKALDMYGPCERCSKEGMLYEARRWNDTQRRLDVEARVCLQCSLHHTIQILHDVQVACRTELEHLPHRRTLHVR